MGLLRDYINRQRTEGDNTIKQIMESGGNYTEEDLKKMSERSGIPIEVLVSAAINNPKDTVGYLQNINNGVYDSNVGTEEDQIGTVNKSELLSNRKPITASEYDQQFGEGGGALKYHSRTVKGF